MKVHKKTAKDYFHRINRAHESIKLTTLNISQRKTQSAIVNNKVKLRRILKLELKSNMKTK